MIKRTFQGISIVSLLWFGCTPQESAQVPIGQEEKQVFAQLVDLINLNHPGLEGVKVAWADRDTVKALNLMLSYFEQSESRKLISGSNVVFPIGTEKGDITAARSILTDTFTLQGVKGKQRRMDNGDIDWLFKGPNDDKEWGYFQNRHNFFLTLLVGYNETNDETFATYFDTSIKDWLKNNPIPDTAIKSLPWRVMEAGSRMLQTWPYAFYGFQQSENFSPQAKLKMLASIPQHTDYLMKYHYTHHNHAVKEMCGLASAAVFWPEFKNANQWFDYAVRQLSDELDFQVYPDGVHKELSGHYHKNVARYFQKFVDLANVGKKRLPAAFEKKITAMTDYLAQTMRPNGYGLNNNDSDLDYIRDGLATSASNSNRADWAYVSSYGQDGEKPSSETYVYPYAGQLIARDNWTDSANWSFFDFGPWGTAHQHNDKLHISVTAFGHDILVDAGRYIYGNDPFRPYFKGSQSHNVVMLDGKGQNPLAEEATEPMAAENYQISPEGSWAWGDYNTGFEDIPGEHHRLFYVNPGKFWLAADQVTSDKNREISALWHFHPDNELTVEQPQVKTQNKKKGNIVMVPLGTINWQMKLINGQEPPNVQGWWSSAYNHKVASPTVIYTCQGGPTESFGWLMVPYKNIEPDVTVHSFTFNRQGLNAAFSINDERFTIDISRE